MIDIYGNEKRTTMIFTSELADIVMVGRMFLAEHEIGRVSIDVFANRECHSA